MPVPGLLRWNSTAFSRQPLHGIGDANNPVPNREMMRILRRVCGAPFGLPAGDWMLEVGAFIMRIETELIVKSRRVIPRRLLESGFQFQFPTLEEAFRDLFWGRL
jgi:hypothetical protein